MQACIANPPKEKGNAEVKRRPSAHLLIWTLLLGSVGAYGDSKPLVDSDLASKSPPTDQLQSLTSEKLLLLAKPATTPQELIKNLYVVWSRKLLIQPAFYEKPVLLRFFGEASIAWDATQRPDSGWTIRTGRVILDQVNFQSVVAALRYSHRVSERHYLAAAKVTVPAYVEDTGQLTIDVSSVTGFTWAAVKRVFGPGFTIRGETPNYHGGVLLQQDFKVDMQYLYAGDDPSKFSAIGLPGAWFLLKQGAVPAAPGKVMPQDTDVVKSIRIYTAVKNSDG